MAEPVTPGVGLLTEADVRAAQTAVDALDSLLVEAGYPALSVPLQQAARGLLATFAADVRWAGYVEGREAGRRLLARAVLEVLQDEGLSS